MTSAITASKVRPYDLRTEKYKFKNTEKLVVAQLKTGGEPANLDQYHN